MAEFGHKGFIDGGMCIDSWGAGPFLLTVDGKEHRFEDSDRFGPNKVNKDGSIPTNEYWSERHPFWRAHRIWVRQGRRVGPDGKTCIWDEPKPTTVQMWGKRSGKVVETGEEDGLIIRLSRAPHV